jgi:hypothetical protein
MSRYINKQKSENLKTLAEAILIWIFDEQDRVKDEGKLVETPTRVRNPWLFQS